MTTSLRRFRSLPSQSILLFLLAMAGGFYLRSRWGIDVLPHIAFVVMVLAIAVMAFVIVAACFALLGDA
jgi:hypothetical protein